MHASCRLETQCFQYCGAGGCWLWWWISASRSVSASAKGAALLFFQDIDALLEGLLYLVKVDGDEIIDADAIVLQIAARSQSGPGAAQ
jgi:hypothetical protein